MSKQERAAINQSSHRTSLPASYLEGAVPISIPQHPSTPVAKSRRRSAPFVRLYTGPPVDPVEEDHGTPLSSGQVSNRTPSSAAKPISLPNLTSTSAQLSSLPQHPHPHDPAESFAAARLESLIPLPFIASASDDRHNVILPPSAPKPAPTRYTILFDAAHTVIMHQSVVNGTAQSARQKKQLEELTRISYRQAKFILELEKHNAALRTLAFQGGLRVTDPVHKLQAISTATLTPTTTLTSKTKKRKRMEEAEQDKEKQKQQSAAYVDGLGNKVEGQQHEVQRKEREKKMRKVLKQRESLLEDNDEAE